MTFALLCFGRNNMGNARVKRAKRGCEKDWNKKGDGAAKFFVRGISRYQSRRHRARFLKKKYRYLD